MFSPGNLARLGNVAITLESNGTSAWFTLTCISIGGPATTVYWTRDFDNVTEGSETVLDDRATSQYTHTLTVTEEIFLMEHTAVKFPTPSHHMVFQKK